MVGSDCFERGLEVGVGVYPINFGRFDETGDASLGCATFVMAGEQCVLEL